MRLDPKRWARSAPTGLIGALVLIGLVEGELRRLEIPWLTTVWALDWRLTGQAATTKARDAGVLCFGDSLAKFGVIPAVVEAGTGERTYNLALNSGPPAAARVLLERALRAGARPKAVLIDAKAHLLAASPWAPVRQWPELMDSRDWFETTVARGEFSLAARIAVGRLFVSARARDEIRSVILEKMSGRVPNHVHALSAARRNWSANAGAQVMGRNPGADRPIDAALEASILGGDGRVDPIQRAEFERFLSLAVGTGARVYWLIPPPVPSVQRRLEESGRDAAYGRFVVETLDRFPTVTVLDGRGSAYPSAVHCDAIHLDRDGAAAFSTVIAERIRADLRLGATRGGWVGLPSYEPAPTVPVEDFDQSRLAAKTAVRIPR